MQKAENMDLIHEQNSSESNDFKYIGIDEIKFQQTNECPQCIVFKLKIDEIQVKCSQLELDNERLRVIIEYYKKKYDLIEEEIQNKLCKECGMPVPSSEIESHTCLNEEKFTVGGSNDIDNLPIPRTELSVERNKQLTSHMKKSSALLRSSKSDVEKHETKTMAKHKAQFYECYICRQTMKNITDMRSHMKQHKIGEKCSVCDEYVSSVVDKFHLCSEGRSINCEYCDESFGTMSALLQHLDVVHANRTMYRCRKCPRNLGMELLRDVHEKHHKDVPKPFVCGFCSKGFTTNVLLKRHTKRMHESGETHLCPLCGKQVTSLTYLKAHMATHGEKKYQCPKCPLAFRVPSRLRNHLDTHSDRKYKCNQCSKEFTSRMSHLKHIGKVHSGKSIIKKYQCTLCPLKFQDKDRFETHKRTHTGEKPFVCTICPDKKYAQKGDLMKHMQNVHDVSYECEVCGQTFRLMKDLKRHSDTHYQEQQQARIE